MGCQESKNPGNVTGFIVPEQELKINELELMHPFSSLYAEDILRMFGTSSREISEKDVFLGCFKISLEIERFFTWPYSEYMRTLRTSSGKIQTYQLIYSAILVCKSPWERKLASILKLHKNCMSVDEILGIVRSMIDTATFVLPSMIFSDNESKLYIRRILMNKEKMLKKIKDMINHRVEYNRRSLIALFRDKSELQRLLWANGIRVMLMEQEFISAHPPELRNVEDLNFAQNNEIASALGYKTNRSHLVFSILGRTEQFRVSAAENLYQAAKDFARERCLNDKEKYSLLNNITNYKRRTLSISTN